MRQLVCVDCHTPSKGTAKSNGSAGTESFLAIVAVLSLLSFNIIFIPLAIFTSLAYSSYRRKNRSIVCPSCDGRMIDTNSPRGREITAEAHQREVNRERDALREEMGRNGASIATTRRVL
jgi:hypothetical protein